MAEIPEGKFKFYTHRDQGSQDAFIAFPDHNDTVVITIHKFYMDKYPVTNIAYYHYIQSSKYSQLIQLPISGIGKTGNTL